MIKTFLINSYLDYPLQEFHFSVVLQFGDSTKDESRK